MSVLETPIGEHISLENSTSFTSKKIISFEEFASLKLELKDEKLYVNEEEVKPSTGKIICERIKNGRVS